jgi:hypothetical protein
MYYEAAIASAGGDVATLTKSLIISLEDVVANWYSRLPTRCIYSWPQLKEKFLLNLQGYQTELDTKEDFLRCALRKKETLQFFTEGSCSSKLKPQKYPMIKSLCRTSKP